MKKFLLLFLSLFVFTNVKAYSTENCSGFVRYVDYSDVYQSIYNDSSYRQFYVDFKDWFNNQNTYSDYLILRQIGLDNSYINRIYLFTDSSINFNFHHKTTNYNNYFALFLFYSVNSRTDIGYFGFNDNNFDSSSLSSCNLQQSNNGCGYDSNDLTYFNGTYSSFSSIDSNTSHKNFTWVVDTNNNLFRGSFVVVDSTFDIKLKGYTGGSESYIQYKVNDIYYCIDDNVPTLQSIYPLDVNPVVPVESLELYDKSVGILGNLPQEYSILYCIFTYFLLFGLLLIIFVPVILLGKKFKS